HRRQHWAVGPYLRMAVHARLRRRHSRKRRGLHGAVTIPTIDAETADVMFVTEWHRLLADDADAGHVIGAHELRPHPAKAGDQEHASEDARPGHRVETAMKDLGHTRELHANRLPRACGISFAKTT